MEISGLCLPLKPQKERGYFGLSIIDSAGSPLEHIKLNKTVSFGYQIMSAKHEGRKSTDGGSTGYGNSYRFYGATTITDRSVVKDNIPEIGG